MQRPSRCGDREHHYLLLSEDGRDLFYLLYSGTSLGYRLSAVRGASNVLSIPWGRAGNALPVDCCSEKWGEAGGCGRQSGAARVTGHTLQPEKLRTMMTFMTSVMGVGPVPQLGSPECVTHGNRLLGPASPPSAKAGTSLPKPG